MLSSFLMEEPTAIFERERRRLIGLAYGLLGSHSEAEDIVQDAWFRFHEAVDEMRQPEAWLTTVVSRLALDRLRSAQHRRETYPGVWLPEPVSALPDPESTQSTRSLLSIGFLHLLERLRPEERAVVVLRTAFDRSYQEIAAVIGKTESACRQILSRAQRRLHEGGAERLGSVPQAVVQQCIEALAAEDEQRLLALLAGDAVLYGDGGGRVPSVLNPIYGAARISRFFLGLLRKYPNRFHSQITWANGQPAMLVTSDAHASVLALSFDGNRVTAFHLISNPEKLAAFAPASAY
jgi:RNA polymerase sigma-70 factor (ECF subfamily)